MTRTFGMERAFQSNMDLGQLAPLFETPLAAGGTGTVVFVIVYGAGWGAKRLILLFTKVEQKKDQLVSELLEQQKLADRRVEMAIARADRTIERELDTRQQSAQKWRQCAVEKSSLAKQAIKQAHELIAQKATDTARIAFLESRIKALTEDRDIARGLLKGLYESGHGEHGAKRED